MDCDMIAVDKVGRKDHQIGAAGVAQRGKQDAAQPSGDDHVRQLPGRRNSLVDAGDLAPGTIPLLPGPVPDVRIEPSRGQNKSCSKSYAKVERSMNIMPPVELVLAA